MVTISDPVFEGPFGLLLELAESGKLPVERVGIAEITARYLTRVRSMPAKNPEELSEFVQLGCRLLYIKSLSLLPRDARKLQVEALVSLNHDLEEYRLYRLAARNLAALLTQGSWHRQAVTKLPSSELPAPKLQLTHLTDAFLQAHARTSTPPNAPALSKRLSQAEMSQQILNQLSSGSFTISSFLRQLSRPDIIVAFLALLELIKSGQVHCEQEQTFDEIKVRVGSSVGRTPVSTPRELVHHG